MLTAEQKEDIVVLSDRVLFPLLMNTPRTPDRINRARILLDLLTRANGSPQGLTDAQALLRSGQYMRAARAIARWSNFL